MIVILYLPQHVRISGFDCTKQDLGNKQLAFVFPMKHTHAYSLILNVLNMHDPGMHTVAERVPRGAKTNTEAYTENICSPDLTSQDLSMMVQMTA